MDRFWGYLQNTAQVHHINYFSDSHPKYEIISHFKIGDKSNRS
jgi:hypothetical protein